MKIPDLGCPFCGQTETLMLLGSHGECGEEILFDRITVACLQGEESCGASILDIDFEESPWEWIRCMAYGIGKSGELVDAVETDDEGRILSFRIRRRTYEVAPGRLRVRYRDAEDGRVYEYQEVELKRGRALLLGVLSDDDRSDQDEPRYLLIKKDLSEQGATEPSHEILDRTQVSSGRARTVLAFGWLCDLEIRLRQTIIHIADRRLDEFLKGVVVEAEAGEKKPLSEILGERMCRHNTRALPGDQPVRSLIELTDWDCWYNVFDQKWDELFPKQKQRKVKNRVLGWIEEIRLFRNAVAHLRALSDAHVEKLRALCSSVGSLLDSLAAQS